MVVRYSLIKEKPSTEPICLSCGHLHIIECLSGSDFKISHSCPVFGLILTVFKKQNKYDLSEGNFKIRGPQRVEYAIYKNEDTK
jgi:hypothetical protein